MTNSIPPACGSLGRNVVEFYIDGGTNGLNGRGADSVYYSVMQTFPLAAPIATRVTSTDFQTNNQAEHLALQAVLAYCQHHVDAGTYILIRSDSQLLINQMLNCWKVKSSNLQRLYA